MVYGLVYLRHEKLEVMISTMLETLLIVVGILTLSMLFIWGILYVLLF